MLPNLHAVQHPLLLLRRQAVEVLQPVLQHLLALRRQAAKLRIALQRPALLFGRNSLILAQPLPGMMPLLRRLAGCMGGRDCGGCGTPRLFCASMLASQLNATPRKAKAHHPVMDSRFNTCSPLSPCHFVIGSSNRARHYGFAFTFDCTCRSSSTSKSEYRSGLLSSACKSPTAVPGCA